MKKTTILCLVVVAGTVALLAGCSGAGTPPSDVRGASIQTLAADNLSALVLFQGWAAMLWVKNNNEIPNPTVVDLGNGRSRIYGRMSIGDTSYDYTFEADGSGSGTITWDDKLLPAITSTWSATTMDGPWMVNTLSDVYSNGARMDYETRVNPSVYGTPQVWIGTARIPSGEKMQFQLHRAMIGHDELDLHLPDGSSLVMDVPLTQVLGATYWPLFQQGATLTYTDPAGAALHLTAKGATDQRWDQWSFTTSGGQSGKFALAADLAGTGQLREGNAVSGALRWSSDGLGALELLGSGQQSVNPSAAAQEFQMSHWVTNVALLGPSPMY